MWALVPAGLAFIFIFFMGNERMVIKKQQKNKKSETKVYEKLPSIGKELFVCTV